MLGPLIHHSQHYRLSEETAVKILKLYVKKFMKLKLSLSQHYLFEKKTILMKKDENVFQNCKFIGLLIM